MSKRSFLVGFALGAAFITLTGTSTCLAASASLLRGRDRVRRGADCLWPIGGGTPPCDVMRQ